MCVCVCMYVCVCVRACVYVCVCVCLHLLPSIYVVAKKQIVGVRRETSVLKQAQQVIVLPVNIT
jgi:hypothetical protein